MTVKGVIRNTNECFAMIVHKTLTHNQKLTSEQIEMIRRAKERPIVYDDDCPNSSPEMLKQLECAARERNRLLRLQGFEPPIKKEITNG